MSDVVPHPNTGEALGLDDAPSDLLAEVQVELKAREAQLKQWRQAVDAELLARLEAGGRRRAVVGDYEIAVEGDRRRDWDSDELEHACQELVADGVLQAGELTGLIAPQPPKVDGKLAAALLTRVTRPARARLERCFSWQRGRPRLSVVKSTPLLPQEDETQ